VIEWAATLIRKDLSFAIYWRDYLLLIKHFKFYINYFLDQFGNNGFACNYWQSIK